MLTVHGSTHTGLVRKINQDTFFFDVAMGLVIVADGMGGHNAGEVASHMAAQTIRDFLDRSRDSEECTWPYGIDPSRPFAVSRLTTAIKLANRRVFKTGESRDEYSGMGTTAVVALFEAERMTYAGVGDSRVYTFLDGHLQQLTQDDSWAARTRSLVPDGAEAAGRNPMKHVLTNVIGAREELTSIEVRERSLQDGELILACTDGIHGPVDDATMELILAAHHDLASAVEQLMQAALQRGGRDNLTVVLARYHA
jgi:protein phosphatase